MTWIMTSTGRRIDFINPDPAQISVDDILTALSRNHRFGGHSPLKIAQHLIEVVELMIRKALEDNPNLSSVAIAEIVLVGLIHDFPEFAVGDCPTPFKNLLRPLFHKAEEVILDAMLTKWNLHAAYSNWADLLKWADGEAVQQEAIRHNLDGYFIDDAGEEHTVPRLWVPEDKEVTLVSDVMDEDFAHAFAGMYFFKAMVLSGRASIIGGFSQGLLENLATESQMTVEEYVTQSNRIASVGTIFLDGYEAYV